MILLLGLCTFVRAMTLGSAAVALENVALRHQLAVLQRSVRRPQFHRWDRALWVCLSQWWRNWRRRLVTVQPATVLAWHRQGFQLYWRWKSRPRAAGRPPIDRDLRELIRRMARENPTWGRRRIQAELHVLGDDVAELTIAKYMRRPRGASWRSRRLVACITATSAPPERRPSLGSSLTQPRRFSVVLDRRRVSPLSGLARRRRDSGFGQFVSSVWSSGSGGEGIFDPDRSGSSSSAEVRAVRSSVCTAGSSSSVDQSTIGST